MSPNSHDDRDEPRWVTFVGLALAFCGFLIAGRVVPDISGIDKFWNSDLTKWLVVVVFFGWVVFAEKRPLESMGFRTPSFKALIYGGIGGGIAAFLFGNVLGGWLVGLLELEPSSETMNELLSLPLHQRFSIAATAAITEELLYRGYPIERLEESFGNLWLAGSLSILLFVGVHLPVWTYTAIIPMSLISLVLVLLYVRYRNLWVVILAHFVVDALGLIVFPALQS